MTGLLDSHRWCRSVHSNNQIVKHMFLLEIYGIIAWHALCLDRDKDDVNLTGFLAAIVYHFILNWVDGMITKNQHPLMFPLVNSNLNYMEKNAA